MFSSTGSTIKQAIVDECFLKIASSESALLYGTTKTFPVTKFESVTGVGKSSSPAASTFGLAETTKGS
ncbi:unannotated protein [freshwater metagenome]|uniref:Unannotated protein n=1 Tax=freshwater metagenome TaxID=449393 RepID=A0A6J7JYL3_9ZZZZ